MHVERRKGTALTVATLGHAKSGDQWRISLQSTRALTDEDAEQDLREVQHTPEQGEMHTTVFVGLPSRLIWLPRRCSGLRRPGILRTGCRPSRRPDWRVGRHNARFRAAGGSVPRVRSHSRQACGSKDAETGLYEDGKGLRRPADPPPARPEWIATSSTRGDYGISAAGSDDREASNEMLHLSHPWLAESAAISRPPHLPGGLPLHIVPLPRIPRSQAGFMGIELSAPGQGSDVASLWEPLCRAIDEVVLPSFPPPAVCRAALAIHRSHPASVLFSAGSVPYNVANILPALRAAVFERTRISPRLRAEGIAGFYVLDRRISSTRTSTKDPRSSSSRRVLRRQCKATFHYDPRGTKLITDGRRDLMWGSTTPPDCGGPESENTQTTSSRPAGDVTRKYFRERRKFYAYQLSARHPIDPRLTSSQCSWGRPPPRGRLP